MIEPKYRAGRCDVLPVFLYRWQGSSRRMCCQSFFLTEESFFSKIQLFKGNPEFIPAVWCMKKKEIS
jgi:hypothetical protein